MNSTEVHGNLHALIHQIDLISFVRKLPISSSCHAFIHSFFPSFPFHVNVVNKKEEILQDNVTCSKMEQQITKAETEVRPKDQKFCFVAAILNLKYAVSWSDASCGLSVRCCFNSHCYSFYNIVFVSSFRNIKDSDPERPMVYDWNPCTKFTEDDDCKDALVGIWS